MKKRVILSALVCFVCMASLVGCGGKKTYKMGEKMEFDEDEGEYTVMITDWGTSLGESLKNILKGKKVTYFEYEVENTGDHTVVIDAEKIFSVYADNYNASMKWPDDSARQKTVYTICKNIPTRIRFILFLYYSSHKRYTKDYLLPLITNFHPIL